MTLEVCKKEMEQWRSLPLERLAYLIGYAMALDPLHCPAAEIWQRLLPERQYIDQYLRQGVADALDEVIFPGLLAAGILSEHMYQAMSVLKGRDLLLWVYAQLDSELAQRYPKRLARITARLGWRAEA